MAYLALTGHSVLIPLFIFAMAFAVAFGVVCIVYYILTRKKAEPGENQPESVPEPEKEEKQEAEAVPIEPEEPVAEEEVPEVIIPAVVENREKVDAHEVNQLMTDTQAEQLVEETDRVADLTKRGHINVDTLAKFFDANETVTLEEIKNRIPFIDKKITFIKVLARGILDKPLVVDLDDYSVDAEKMILLTGGKVYRPIMPDESSDGE